MAGILYECDGIDCAGGRSCARPAGTWLGVAAT